MNRTTLSVLLAAALACAGLAASCTGPSPWLRTQRELRSLQDAAIRARELATDPGTRARLAACATSALAGIQRADDYLAAAEKLRQAKRAGAAIPELEDSAREALRRAERAEKEAHRDCVRAGVSGVPLREEALDGGSEPGSDVSTAHVDAAASPAEALDGGSGPAPATAPASAPALVHPATQPVPDGGGS